MRNPKHVIVETIAYEASHGKLPRGKGTWAFSVERNPKIEDVYFTNGTYAEAKYAAQCRFAYSVCIYVQP